MRKSQQEIVEIPDTEKKKESFKAQITHLELYNSYIKDEIVCRGLC